MYGLRSKLYTNYTQTIHKLYIEAFKTLHNERSKPYTTSVRETIHEAEHKPYILFLNTNQTNGTNEREWIVRDERNVRNERDVRDERKTGNGNRRWTTFSTPNTLFRF